MSTFHQKWYLMPVRVWMIDSWTLAKVWTVKSNFNDRESWYYPFKCKIGFGLLSTIDQERISFLLPLVSFTILPSLSFLNSFRSFRSYRITGIEFISQCTCLWFVWYKFRDLCDGDYAELHSEGRSAFNKLIPKRGTLTPKPFVHENMRRFCISNLPSLSPSVLIMWGLTV